MFDSDPFATYSYFLEQLSKRNVAFIEVMRAPEFVPVSNLYGIKGEDQMPNIFQDLKRYFNGVFIGNNQISFDEANKLIEEGFLDMIAFGRMYIPNPDLVERYTNGWPYNEMDNSKNYSSGREGYSDYPKYKK
jgi:2,4-dienoyl-CoA reductase-like NADH-dependent reductase (Old Yellow Enzyme family)